MQRRPRIAVVDDDEGMRRALHRLLRSSGMDVTTYDSGTAILRGLRHRPVDCVVLDVQLPDFKALELFERLRLAHPGLPLVVMTAWEDDDLRQRALNHGAAGFFYKPFGDDAFLATLQNAAAGAEIAPQVHEKIHPRVATE